MKRIAWLFFLLFGIADALDFQVQEPTPAPVPEDPRAKLRWQNHETIPGELRDASATELSWQSPLFQEPLRLRWDAVRRIDQTVPAAAAPEAFGVALRDGSHLLGDLVGIDADTVTIKSARHGEVMLKRSEVLRLRRVRGGKIIAAGPAGDVGWKLEQATDSTPPPTLPRLITGSGGALVLPYWNTQANLEIKTPDRIEIEFDVRFSEFPAFALRFDGDATTGIRIETWDDELVIVHGNEFVSVRKIEENERDLFLRLRWDRKTKKGALFTRSGEPLAELEFTGDFGTSPDWLLNNKGRDLTLTHFRVREWDGKPPVKFDATKARVEMADGTVFEGSVLEASTDGLKIAGDSKARQPLPEVVEIVLAPEGPKPNDDSLKFTFSDSTVCYGPLLSIAEGRAMLQTAFASAPLPISMTGLRQVLLKRS
ncbi:MAG: hypothetical protein ABIO94_03500, partial [Opitutaceae bacterium]